MRNSLLARACAIPLALAVSVQALAQAPSGPAATTPPPVQGTSSASSPRYRVNAPAGAPNVVVVLLDDVGFGAASTFGGPVATPALDALARQGLRYNRFHTTSICSPTRTSLLTGRNPHAAGMGAVMNSIDARPGYSGFHPRDTASVARILQQHGYATAAFGKWHQTPDWEATPAGPFDRWPTGEGFDRFYGFLGGETDQFDPTLIDDTRPVMRPEGEGYHLTADLATQAIRWFGMQKEMRPDQPAFIYFAPGATHAPLQAPREYIERFRGKFDQGWDKLREEIFARQKKLGVIPKDTLLTPRNARLPAWDSLTPDQQRVAARQMEIYAGFLAHTDEQVGRLIDMLKRKGEFDNTLFFYIVGDNGSSGEGGLLGSGNYMGAFQGMPETDEIRLAEIDKIGGPDSYPHFAAGWAWALCTPFQWVKTVASHLGGTRNAMVVSWPEGIAHPGGLRSQFSHVNDIAPSILEAAHIAIPQEVDGIAQKPMDGTSLLYSFNDAKAEERHETQYFEVFGNRSIYHNGWMASAFHGRVPWDAMGAKLRPFEQDTWELYDLDHDFSQAKDLAAKEPQRLAALKALFQREAARNQVLPLRNLVGSDKTGLPTIAAGRKSMSFGEGTRGIPEMSLPRIFNTSYHVTATFDAGAHARGVIVSVGGRSAGWSIWLDKQRRPVLTYRLFNIKLVTITGDAPLPPGKHELRFDFDYDGGGWARGGDVRLSVDGKPAGSDHVPASPPVFFTLDETFDVGLDHGSPVAAYPQGSPLGYPLADVRVDQVRIEAE